MDFPKLLGLRPGVTAVIGSGGKTSLLRRLAEELPGTVLLCTTTHIRPFEEYPLLTAPTPEDIRKALAAHRVLCLGTPCENGKLTEAFGTGTAAVVSPVGELAYRDKHIMIGDKSVNNGIGELTMKLYNTLTGLQWGRIEDTHGWVTDIDKK